MEEAKEELPDMSVTLAEWVFVKQCGGKQCLGLREQWKYRHQNMEQ